MRIRPILSLRAPKVRSNPKTKYLIFITLVVFLLSGCATLLKDESIPDYKIRTGDELRIVIWKELDEKVIVRPDGKISLPLVGEAVSFNKTPSALSRELSKRYNQKVTVIVSKFKTAKDNFKDILSILRDVFFVYLFADRVSDD